MTITSLEDLFFKYKETTLNGRYITLKHIEPLLKILSKKIEITIIGYSILKKPIYKIVLGSGAKRVLMWSQMHGNESTTTKSIFDILNVFTNFKNEALDTILSKCNISIIPILNPDGAESYTRLNANNVDLNRDAQELSQPESNVLRDEFESFKPDFCFNLHGQRTIFSAGNKKNSATLSFLAPAQDKESSITNSRKIAMEIISKINSSLQEDIPNQIGIYDDSFNINCVGDTFQSTGTPTILFEAGHYNKDYNREVTRKLVFKSLLLSLNTIATNVNLGSNYKTYFNIPENQKLFRDIIIKNAAVDGEIKDIVIQYKEVLEQESIKFLPIIESIENKVKLFAHKEINADYKKIETSTDLIIGNVIVFVKINNRNFTLLS